MNAAYTHGHHHTVTSAHARRGVDDSAAYVRDRLVPGVDLLDVGSGPGSITIEMQQLVAPGRVVGVEHAEEALRLARAAAQEQGVEVEFVRGDAAALAFPDDSFDVVHAHQVMHHLVDPVAALREMGRVCRPDGVVAVRETDYAAMTWYPEPPGLVDWLATYRAVAIANGAQPDAGRRLLSWARQAGFTEIVPSASVWLYATPEEREFWGGGWARRVVESDFARQAVDLGAATEADLREMSAAWREWAGADGAWFAVLHGEVVCPGSGFSTNQAGP
jgi:ubiquinone/menaquinone biosynthesis C-methylase UbiE